MELCGTEWYCVERKGKVLLGKETNDTVWKGKEWNCWERERNC